MWFYAIEELEKLASSHPDKSRRNFYLACFSLLSPTVNSKKTSDLFVYLDPFVSKLNQDSIGHFWNLLSHTHLAEYLFLMDNYVFIRESKTIQVLPYFALRPGAPHTHYSDFSKEDWIDVITIQLRNPSIIQLTTHELENHTTQTFVLNRYIGAHIVLKEIFHDQPISVVDAGCSLGDALPAMAFGRIPLEKVVIDNFELSERHIQPITLDGAMCFDIAHVEEEETQRWIEACMFYPGESSSLPNAMELHKELIELRAALNFSLFTGGDGDISKMDTKLTHNSIDAVIINTTLYQMTPELRTKTFYATKQVLKEGGLLIITDFARLDDQEIAFPQTWFGDEPQYRTIILQKIRGDLSNPIEVFHYNSARCTRICYVGGKYDKNVFESLCAHISRT